MTFFKCIRTLWTWGLLLPGLTALPGLSWAQHAEGEYAVGVVPQFDTREIERVWKPLLAEISKLAGVALVLHSSPTIPEFERQFAEGGFDFAYMNPYHLIEAQRSQGYVPIIRDTSKSLFGIIVVKTDSPIQALQELDGKVVAMPAPNALGAALLPRAEFATIYNIKPTYKYVRSHDSVYLNVVLGQAAAGGGVMASLSKQSDQIRNGLRILYKTHGVPSHPFVVHPRTPEAISTAVQQAFIKLNDTPEGHTLLAKVPIKQAGVTNIDAYEPLKSLGLDKFYVRDE